MSEGLVRTASRVLSEAGVAGIGTLARYVSALLRANVLLLLHGCAPASLFLDRGATVEGVRHLRFGRAVRLGPRSRITVYSGGAFTIGDRFSLGDASILENGFNVLAKCGVIRIGCNVGIGAFSFISCPSRVIIGDDCIIGQYFSVHPQNHVFDGDQLIRNQGTTETGVDIGSNCWIGAKVTVLDGVSIGHGSVVAAGAVVTKSFPPRSLIGGCPARLLRSLSR